MIPSSLCASNGLFGVAKYLFNGKYNINSICEYGWTLLHFAVQKVMILLILNN